MPVHSCKRYSKSNNCTAEHFFASQNSLLCILCNSRLSKYKLLKCNGNYDHGFCKGAVVEDHKADLYESLLMMTTLTAHRSRSSKHKCHSTSSTDTLTLLRSINKLWFCSKFYNLTVKYKANSYYNEKINSDIRRTKTASTLKQCLTELNREM